MTDSVAPHHSASKKPSWYRGFIQGKTRIALAWIFSAVLILSARDFPWWPGIVVCFLGASLRYWASGYLLKDTQVSVGGPYSWTRNPLYLGTYLMALGAALAVENWILFFVVTVVFAAIYHFIILDEEEKLEKNFGKPYQTYCETVPRFFPRVWPISKDRLLKINPNSDLLKFSSKVAVKNKAYEAYAAFAGLIGAISILAIFWSQWSN